MAHSKSEIPGLTTTGPKSEIDGSIRRLLHAVLAVVWLVLILGCFFSVELIKNPPFSRWDFWAFVPDVVDPPPPDATAGHSGWQFFPQRLDLLAVAGVILGGAWGAGHLVLRIVGPPLAAPRLERAGHMEYTVFAFGLGLATLSLVTLGAGLVGWLSRPFLGGVIAVAVVGEIVLRIVRITHNPGVGADLKRIGPTGSPNPKSEIRNPKLTLAWFALLAVPAAPFLLAMLLGSLLPSTDFDVNEYHFEGPKEFFQTGRVSFLEHNVYTSFPFGTEMLTLLAMVLSNDWYRGALAGKCVLMCFGPLTALALLAAGRCCFGRTGFGTLAGTCAALLYLATPWVFRISTIAYAEGGLCFYLLSALLAVMIAIKCGTFSPDCESAGITGIDSPIRPESVRGEWRQFVLAGLLAGSAMACKYPALVSVVVPLGAAVLVSVWRSRSNGGLRWSGAAGFGLGVLIAVGPWLVKNFFETGNPVYPLAYRLFDGRDWDATLNARWLKAHSPSTFAPASLGDLALDVAFRSTWVSPLLMGLAPWTLFASRLRRRTIWLWCYVGWLLFSCWLFTHRIDRFWVPLLPVVALLAGAGAAWWWFEFPRRWARAALAIPLVAVGLFQLAFISDPHAFCGYNDFLRDLDEASKVAAHITAPELVYLNEQLPRSVKVLSVGDAEMFEARFPAVYNTVFDRSIFEDWFAAPAGPQGPGEAEAGGGLRDRAAIRTKLADEGITHIYVNWLEILRYRAPGSYGYSDFVTPERFAELKKLGILEREWSISEATMEVDRLDEPRREELEKWGKKLKIRQGLKEAFTTFQVFPVAAAEPGSVSNRTLPAAVGDTNPKREGHLVPPLRKGGQGGAGDNALWPALHDNRTQWRGFYGRSIRHANDSAIRNRSARTAQSPRHATPPFLRGGDTTRRRLDDGNALLNIAPAESKPFRIQVVDDETGRGVPLVELTTVNNIVYLTDSNGIVAFAEPGLSDQSVFFHVTSHGYEFPKDGFGFRGQALKVAAGGTATLKIKRLNVAHRLYRMTGAGIYRDSELCGFDLPIRQPLINGKVTGSDSVVNAVYNGKIYWFWGDTNRPGYPLGNYHVPGATAELPGKTGLDPRVGVDLTYFVDETGFARPTAQMPGEGPTWIHGLTVLPDGQGRDRMFAAYMKVKPPLEIYEQGLAEFDDAISAFKKVKSFENDAPAYPGGHPFMAGAGEARYVYFSRPYPLVRVRATPAGLANLDEYEAFTCLKPGSRLNKPEIDRGSEGKIRYAWKPDTPAVGPAEQARLIAAKMIQPEEALLQLADRDTGKAVFAHNGSVYWNEFRKRWVMIAVEIGGAPSHLGEVWYSEADSTVGPWAYAVKIVTHNRYSFYNPKQHPMFDRRDGRSIFFEGTYTNSFSGNNDQTPRYDYNQIMYRLDLDDPRVVVPVAFYSQPGSDQFTVRPPAFNAADALNLPELSGIAFFASDRPASGLLALCQTTQGKHRLATRAAPVADEQLVCYVLPTDAAKPQAAGVPLYEYAADDGRRAYSTDPGLRRAGFQRQEQPVCRVWKNPWRQ